MPILKEYLRYYAPDRKLHPRYLEPLFWLSGKYIRFSTPTVSFVSLGTEAVRWVYRLSDQHPTDFAQLMMNATAVGTQLTLAEHIKFVRTSMPTGIFSLKGTTEHCIKLPRTNPKHLSYAARSEMASFALRYPYLIDALRLDALPDLTLHTDHRFTPQELIKLRRIPGPIFEYWATNFPLLVPHIYTSIKRHGQNVVGYDIRPVAKEFAHVVGINPKTLLKY